MEKSNPEKKKNRQKVELINNASNIDELKTAIKQVLGLE